MSYTFGSERSLIGSPIKRIPQKIGPIKCLFNISKIADNIYLCGACAIKPNTLESLGITCLINATTLRELSDPPLPSSVGIYRRIPIEDKPTSDIGHYFDRIADLMHKIVQNGGKVLIHCVAGVSRSASLCLAYFVKHGRMSLAQAYNHLKEKRPCIRPNIGFFAQLVQFEKRFRCVPSVSLIYDHTARAHIPDVYIEHYNNNSNNNSDYKYSSTGTYKTMANIRQGPVPIRCPMLKEGSSTL